MTVKTYDSGLTVIAEENSALRSVTAGITVGAGSVFETLENSGISHFIEHMQFKGTKTRTAADIVSRFDRAGAAYNAFTGKEYTCFYFKSIDEKLEECFDLLSDLFLNAVYAKDELDRERKVILEEINMSRDEPDGVCYDVLYKTAFDGSLGMEILGTADNVKRFGKDEILEYKKYNYLPSNTVVAFVGNITAQTAFELVERYMGEWVNVPYTQPRKSPPQTYVGGYGEYIRDYEQSEISIAFPALTFTDANVGTLAALDCILGSGMSSRLFQRLREQMGLVYSVYTTPWYGKTNGLFSINANVNACNIEKSIDAIRGEIDLLTERGVTDEETEKAKMQLKVTALFGKENPMNYMLALVRWQIMSGRAYDIDTFIKSIEDVTKKKIDDMAHKIFTCAVPTFAYAGKNTDVKIDKAFRRIM